MSRWSTPWSCAYARASAIWRPTLATRPWYGDLSRPDAAMVFAPATATRGLPAVASASPATVPVRPYSTSSIVASASWRPVSRPRAAVAASVGEAPDAAPRRRGARGRPRGPPPASDRDELHREVMVALVLAHAEDLHDVRMVQRGHQVGLAAEPLQRRRPVEQPPREDLQRHPPPERLLDRLVDDPHAAPADLADDPEVAQPLRHAVAALPRRPARLAGRDPPGPRLLDAGAARGRPRGSPRRDPDAAPRTRRGSAPRRAGSAAGIPRRAPRPDCARSAPSFMGPTGRGPSAGRVGPIRRLPGGSCRSSSRRVRSGCWPPSRRSRAPAPPRRCSTARSAARQSTSRSIAARSSSASRTRAWSSARAAAWLGDVSRPSSWAASETELACGMMRRPSPTSRPASRTRVPRCLRCTALSRTPVMWRIHKNIGIAGLRRNPGNDRANSM